MKIGFGKRILMFFHWLFSLLLFAAVAVSIFFPGILGSAFDLLSSWMGAYSRIGFLVLGIAFGVIYFLLSIVQAGIVFKRRPPRSERGFITVDSSDNSRVRIAISAIEQMVRQSVCSIDGISDMKIAIESADDAIVININASILNGRHVPTITMNMQQAIRKFVELNCGVAVQSVAVSINSVTNTDANVRKKYRGNRVAHTEETVAPIVPVVYEPPVVEAAPVAEVESVVEDTVEEAVEIQESLMEEATEFCDNSEIDAAQEGVDNPETNAECSLDDDESERQV